LTGLPFHLVTPNNNNQVKYPWFAVALGTIFFSFGCFPDDKRSLEPNNFLTSLKEEGFLPIAVPVENHPVLKRVFLEKTPVGVYEFDKSMFAIFTQESTETLVADDQNGTLGILSNENLTLVTNQKCNPKVVELFESMRPSLSYKQAGPFVYPLGICLLVAVFVITERTYALRRGLTFPRKVEKALMNGEFPDKRWKKRSAAERIVFVAIHEKPSPGSLIAYARLEVAALEQGFFLLEVVVAGAPLIGLLGTVTGLVRVFSALPSEGGVGGGAEVFSEGIALALLTTIMGLAIAIPALIGHSYLVRVVEKRAASLDWLSARLVDAISTPTTKSGSG
jgi:biopolymer transport protein ExbB